MIMASACLMLLFLLVPGLVGQLFGIRSVEGIAVAQSALRMYALCLPLYGTNILLQNYYQTTGRQHLSTLIVIMNGFVFVVLFAFILSGIDSSLIFLSFMLSEFTTLIVVLLVAARMRKKENSEGILLLKKIDDFGVFTDKTIPATVEASTGLSSFLIDFCSENGVDKSGAMRVGIAVEEMAVNTALYGHKDKKGVIDVLVRIMDDEVILRLRDDGIAFDPTQYSSEENESFATGGIEVVRRLAKDVSYIRQLGFNVSIITIPRKNI
jgi:anti-sigma regulatory factor (Ser/Thr protein kinase)